MLKTLVRLVLARPRLKRIARRVLRAAPGLQARLQWHLQRAPPRPAATQRLSPRARQLHGQLTRARKDA
jgi:hypothetical protein